jgi:hypothetical protein
LRNPIMLFIFFFNFSVVECLKTTGFLVELISSSVSKQPYRQWLFLFGLIDI